MQTFAEISAIREQVKTFRREGRKVAFVPTMGNLHEGHLTLVRKAREYADVVVVSIFVNPMQFDRADDLNNYPRTLEEDLSKLGGEGVEMVFTPTPEIIYQKAWTNKRLLTYRAYQPSLKVLLAQVTSVVLPPS